MDQCFKQIKPIFVKNQKQKKYHQCKYLWWKTTKQILEIQKGLTKDKKAQNSELQQSFMYSTSLDEQLQPPKYSICKSFKCTNKNILLTGAGNCPPSVSEDHTVVSEWWGGGITAHPIRHLLADSFKKPYSSIS